MCYRGEAAAREGLMVGENLSERCGQVGHEIRFRTIRMIVWLLINNLFCKAENSKQ